MARPRKYPVDADTAPVMDPVVEEKTEAVEEQPQPEIKHVFRLLKNYRPMDKFMVMEPSSDPESDEMLERKPKGFREYTEMVPGPYPGDDDEPRIIRAATDEWAKVAKGTLIKVTKNDANHLRNNRLGEYVGHAEFS